MSNPIDLATLDQIRDHVRGVEGADDNDLALKITQASAIVLDYLKTSPDPAYTPDTVPPVIQAAVFLMVAQLYAVREAGDTSNDIANGYLPLSVTSILHRLRDPAMS